jgi:hypothetical protein
MSLLFLIDTQLDAYIKKDIEKLLTFYTEHIKFISLDSGDILLEGKNAVRKNHLKTIFNHENLKIVILSRIILDNIVIYLEEITGLKKKYSISMYKVENNRISEIWCKNGDSSEFQNHEITRTANNEL